jgi:uncharacterized spore protein YtfJ
MGVVSSPPISRMEGRAMTIEGSEAMEEARRAAEKERTADRLIERLIERISGRTGVKAVFGEPVERGDATVVTVSRVRWFFGAGAGSAGMPGDDEDSGGSGSGGGGGVVADPVGYLEMGPTGVRFRPIVGLPPNPLAILAVGLSVALVLNALARLLRR